MYKRLSRCCEDTVLACCYKDYALTGQKVYGSSSDVSLTAVVS
jgi:hypothetical protein